MGEHEKVAEDRPYTHSEVQMIIARASLRNKAIVLLMSSAGLRVGAIPLLRIKDIEPMDKYNLYKVNIYSRSKKSACFSFCTPECRTAIDLYLDWRKCFGERLKDDAPLFRKDFNVNGERVPYPQPLGIQALQRLILVLLHQTGLRDIPLEDYKHSRNQVMMNHGFRKFFETNAFKAGMDNIYIRRLMGQKSA
jgi:integrase